MTVVYNQGLATLSPATFASEDIRVLLTTSAYVPDRDSSFVSAVTGELTAANYVRKVLTGKTATRDDVLDRVVYRADSVLWLALGIDNPARVVIFKFVTNDADSKLLACIDIVSPVASNGTDFSLHWNASGILVLAQV